MLFHVAGLQTWFQGFGGVWVSGMLFSVGIGLGGGVLWVSCMLLFVAVSGVPDCTSPWLRYQVCPSSSVVESGNQ